MLLGVKQYTVFIVFFIICLVSLFAYQITTKLDNTRQNIEASQRHSSSDELHHAITITLENIRRSTDELSQWQEVRQQIGTPDIFAYWYNVRFKKYAFDLQRFTQDLMLYDVNGEALNRLDDNTLPYEIDSKAIDDFSFRIINGSDIITIVPVYMDDNNDAIIGYLSTRVRLLPLLKSLSRFQYIELDSLTLRADDPTLLISELQVENFSYDLRKAEVIMLLESQMRESIISLILIIVAPTMILFFVLVFIIGMPIKEIDKYINRLRIDPEVINEKSYHGFFQVKELQSVYDSLVKYHNELSQKEQNISLTLNSIGDAVITTDAENKVVRMNPVAERLTGWAFTEAEGKQLKQIFNIIDALGKKEIADPFSEVLQTGRNVRINEDNILVSKQGAEYHISNSAAPIRDEAGNILGLVLVFNDITERKLKDEQLQQSQKMDALGQLTGGIAHDFNNLLGVILGYAELLTSLFSAQEKPLRYAQQIHDAGERARRLTAKLLTFSRGETPEATIADVNQLLLLEQHLLEKTLTPRIELTLDLDDDAWPVSIDQSQLRDAILNISINAMHAMPDGGRLTIRTKKYVIDDVDKRSTDLDVGDYMQLSISDTGIGMSQEVCRRIFEPFFTTKGDKGTGLGMSQVYGFVQQSDGAIQAYSQPGAGTRITIYLPRYQGSESEPRDVQASELYSEVKPTGNETILVVDDEPALVTLSCQILSSHGYRTLAAGSGSEAMEILEKQPVDLLLTDVIMPRMDGYQLADIVTKKYPQLKVQMVSGYSDDLHTDIADGRLRQRQLHKPFSSSELLMRVRETLDG